MVLRLNAYMCIDECVGVCGGGSLSQEAELRVLFDNYQANNDAVDAWKRIQVSIRNSHSQGL